MLFSPRLLDFLLPILDEVFPPRKTALLVRTATRELLRTKTAPKLYARGSIVVLSSLPYKDILTQALMIEAKYHKNKRAHELLGTALTESICVSAAKWFPDAPRDFVLVPIPLGARRRRARGYNQSEEIAKYGVKAFMELPSNIRLSLETSLLRRVRETLPQTTLAARDRRKNVRGAFEAIRLPDPTRLYIIFDDVCSTGSTLLAAEQALREAGASFIYTVSLAH